MRRASRPWSILVLVLVAALLGPPAVASASDAGLRALVQQQRAAEKRTDARVAAAPSDIDSATSVEQATRRAARYFRSISRAFGGLRRADDGFRRKFAAEGPETPEAEQGRALVLRALKDQSRDLRKFELLYRRAATQIRRVRTEAQGRRFDRRLARDNTAIGRTLERIDKVLKRGRTLIRTAPAAVQPAPAT